MSKVVRTVLVLSLSGCVVWDQNEEPAIGSARYVGEKIVHHYQPRSNLVTSVHEIERARFPVIDVHCHWTLEADPQAMIQAMERRNIRAAVNLSGNWGRQLDEMLNKFGRHPQRFIIFCSPDLDRVDEPDFGPQFADFMEHAQKRGVRGLKISKELGLWVKDQSGQRVAVDDPRLDSIWARAAQLRMPVLIHTADPVAFFQTMDRFNERWLQLARRPNWSFHGDAYPDRDTLLAERNRVIEKHRETTFIGAHVANSAEDLGRVSSWLDRYPNLMLDIAGRVAELGRQPYSARRFFLKYQDRILFGTDRYPGRTDQPRYRVCFRFLETADEYFDYYEHSFPPTGEWKIYGIHLPDEVLRKVYYQNAARIFGLDYSND